MKIRRSAVVGLTVLSVGCEPPETPPQNVTVRDSAGIRIVENGPVAGVEAPWRLSEERLFRVGWDEAGPFFVNVLNGVIMGDGRFAVADYSENRIYILTRAGVVDAEIGRSGEGPGEFLRISGLVALGGDTLLVHDSGNQRLHYFASDLLVYDTHLARPTGSTEEGRVFFEVKAALRTPSGDLLMLPAMVGYSPPPPDGWVAFPILRVTPDGEVDTLAHIDDSEFQGGVFSDMGTVGAIPGGILYARSDRAEVQWLDEQGAIIQLARWEPERVELTDDVWSQYEQAYRATRPGLEEAEYRERLARSKGAAEGPLPLFRAIYGDSDGNAWVADYTLSSRLQPRTYSVIRRSGEWLGSVTFPEDFRVLQIGSNFVLGVETDEFDVQAVSVYQIVKDGG